jgi:hypothetical protein
MTFLKTLINSSNMKKCRIVERTFDGKSQYVIQQKHHIFRWWWVDAWVNSWDGSWCHDSFSTLEEAKENLKYFDGTKCTEKVVY